jgi:hypothetical protein
MFAHWDIVGRADKRITVTTDQQDQIILGYLRSHFAGTIDRILASTIAAGTAIQQDAVQRSLERLTSAYIIEAVISEDADAPIRVLSMSISGG